MYSNISGDFNFSNWDFGNLNSTDDGNLFYFLSLKDKHTFYIFIGLIVSASILIIATIAFVIHRKRHPIRMGLARKFDTFQNPIYEKAVVRVPIEVETTEINKTKADLEEISDSTVLE